MKTNPPVRAEFGAIGGASEHHKSAEKGIDGLHDIYAFQRAAHSIDGAENGPACSTDSLANEVIECIFAFLGNKDR